MGQGDRIVTNPTAMAVMECALAVVEKWPAPIKMGDAIGGERGAKESKMTQLFRSHPNLDKNSGGDWGRRWGLKMLSKLCDRAQWNAQFWRDCAKNWKFCGCDSKGDRSVEKLSRVPEKRSRSINFRNSWSKRSRQESCHPYLLNLYMEMERAKESLNHPCPNQRTKIRMSN